MKIKKEVMREIERLYNRYRVPVNRYMYTWIRSEDRCIFLFLLLAGHSEAFTALFFLPVFTWCYTEIQLLWFMNDRAAPSITTIFSIGTLPVGL